MTFTPGRARRLNAFSSGRFPGGGREGVTLIELIVSVLLLSLGATLSIRALTEAVRSVEDAELTLRAVIYLGELSALPSDERAEAAGTRPAGPGSLVPVTDVEGRLVVRYRPPSSTTSALREESARGFQLSRVWVVPSES